MLTRRDFMAECAVAGAAIAAASVSPRPIFAATPRVRAAVVPIQQCLDPHGSAVPRRDGNSGPLSPARGNARRRRQSRTELKRNFAAGTYICSPP